MMLRTALRLALIPWLASALAAQDPVLRQAVINSTTNEPEVVRSMLSEQKSVAVTADGRIFGLVHYEDGSWKTTGNALDPVRDTSRFLLLYVSADAGRTWTRVTDMRTTGDHYGSMVVDPDGYTLHIAWYAWNGKKDAANWYNSVFFASYDTRAMAFKSATDTVLVAGADSSNLTFSVPDIAVTARGVIGVVFACARGVPAGWVGATGQWNAGLLWFKNDKWSAPHRVNADTTGVSANIQAHGDDFHMCYRVAVGGYGIEYRRFDTLTEQFGAEGEIPVVPDQANPKRNIANLYANNISQLAVQPNGDVYLLYVTGTSPTTGGKLWFAYSKAGAYQFQTPLQIDDDSGMGWGNNTYRFYCLARNDGSVVALYSKLVEQNSNLYMRVLTPTTTVPPYPQPAVKLRTGVANEFGPYLSGHRVVGSRTATYATYSDLHPIGPLTGGSTRFLGGVAGAVVFKGKGCSGSLAMVPRLDGDSLPSPGLTLQLGLSDHPASTAAVLFLGLDDRKLLGTIPLPIELVFLGLPTCWLSQDVALSLPYGVDAQGRAQVQIPLPNNPALVGLPLFWQAYVVAPTANPGRAVLSNGLATVPR